MARSTKRLDELTTKVLEEWLGTPEELGAAMADATMAIDPPGWSAEDKARWKQDLERKSLAKHRIRSCPTGAELLKEQAKFM